MKDLFNIWDSFFWGGGGGGGDNSWLKSNLRGGGIAADTCSILTTQGEFYRPSVTFIVILLLQLSKLLGESCASFDA